MKTRTPATHDRAFINNWGREGRLGSDTDSRGTGSPLYLPEPLGVNLCGVCACVPFSLKNTLIKIKAASEL